MDCESPHRVVLRANEERIFQFLLDVVSTFSLGTVMRVAGGWVRDKLLGVDSMDIDIALDNVMGAEFARYVNQLLSDRGEEVHNIGVIAANPEESKHLETATMRVFGEWIDLVNLRCSGYTSSGGGKSATIGSAGEDASLRDLTVNSLFYNINTGQVEDLTGKGLSDLAKGIIRTPIPPGETFADDPLRVLRAVRFASKLNFRLDEELVRAALLPSVHAALLNRVSRERVGKEILSMVKGDKPELAVEHLHALGLLAVVFALPPTTTTDSPSASDGGVGVVVPSDAMRDAASSSVRLAKAIGWAMDQMHMVVLCGLLLCFRSSVSTVGRRSVPLPTHLIKENLRAPKRMAEQVHLTLSHVDPMCNVLRHGLRDKDGFSLVSRYQLGSLLRSVGPSWRLCAIAAMVSMHLDGGGTHHRQGEVLCALETRVEELHLDGVWEMKPLLQGKELMEVLGIRPGPMVGSITQNMIGWQLNNPHLGRKECIEWLKESNGGV